MNRLLKHWRLTGRSEAFSAKVRLIDMAQRPAPPRRVIRGPVGRNRRARPGSRERFQERLRECSNFSVLSDSFPIK
jgi:hypothetical protein